ncbi:MAG: triose-phosphate isomerase, partial [Patescibacteria group bacterium]
MKPLIIANWKMKLLPIEQRRMAAGVVRMMKGRRSPSIALCPTFENLAIVSDVMKGSPVTLCAQNCFWEERGAYT